MNIVREGKKVIVDNISITPIEKLVIHGKANRFGLNIFVEYEPLGVIVESGEVSRVWDIHGRPTSKEQLFS